MNIFPALFKAAVGGAVFGIAIGLKRDFVLYRIGTCFLQDAFKTAGLFFFTLFLVFALGNSIV